MDLFTRDILIDRLGWFVPLNELLITMEVIREQELEPMPSVGEKVNTIVEDTTKEVDALLKEVEDSFGDRKDIPADEFWSRAAVMMADKHNVEIRKSLVGSKREEEDEEIYTTFITSYIDYSSVMGGVDSSEPFVHQTAPHHFTQPLSTSIAFHFNGEQMVKEITEIGNAQLFEARPVKERKKKAKRVFTWKFQTNSSNQTLYGKPFQSQFEIFIPQPSREDLIRDMADKRESKPVVRVKFQNNQRWVMETYELKQFLFLPFASMMPEDKREDLLAQASRLQVWIENERASLYNALMPSNANVCSKSVDTGMGIDKKEAVE